MKIQRVRNDQWYVKEIIGKIRNNEIVKPKYQRPTKWIKTPDTRNKKNVPSIREYIDFLFQTQNSVHPITFGETENGFLTNIDGNNRLNAISTFLGTPFEIYAEYLDEVKVFIQDHFEDKDIQCEILAIFKTMTYEALMTFKYNQYFKQIGKSDLYTAHLQVKRDDFEMIIESLQTKLKVDGRDQFDTTVKINVNIFEGYSTDELCRVFEDLNKHNNKLTEIELLASRLYNETDFKIQDNVMETDLKNILSDFYDKRKGGEILNCYEYKMDSKMNAYDFGVALQNYASSKCGLIEPVNTEGLSLLFKLYKTLYGGLDGTFTTKNVNDYIDKIIRVIDILNIIKNNIFTDRLLLSKSKLFDVCHSKLSALKKNNMYVIISAIIGFLEKATAPDRIANSIEKCILYHFFVKEIANKETKKSYRNYDSIMYEAGGAYIDNKAGELYRKPESITEDITRERMANVISILQDQTKKDMAYDSRDTGSKRRTRKYFETILIFYFYKNKVPYEFLSNLYWIEHLCPYSCLWKNALDIDRLGNTVPIIDKINRDRKNKHIHEYKALDDSGFMRFVSDIIPEEYIYNKIVDHSTKTPCILDTDAYNAFCEKNEETYKTNFLKMIYM